MNNDPFESIRAAHEKVVANHAALRSSEPFVAQTKRLQRLTEGVTFGIHAMWMMSTRSSTYDEFLSFRFIDDTLQSVVAVWSLAREGQLTVAKRELRYLLESVSKHVYADLKLMGKPLAEKITFLADHIPSSSVSFVEDFRLYSYSDPENKAFMGEIKSQYSSLCRYVHRSPEQVQESLRLLTQGISPGFETPKQLESFVRELERVYDVLLVLLFNALGPGLAGDVFVHMLDDHRTWPYHKTRFTKLFSREFDYKAERRPL
ncbi:hypothetical protein EV699_10699 [Plasticicumulans lactativorans]|uniref:Uncharacterized protein n=1 Tax=Plasticicumulans lactativorans TaxID=1133106 RepID=A0A4R2LGB4_9GAMM|nr:hypothetical protein [Plasticicumulans lactativorans]TCO82004.1 hypothetical protein EV699_10699 [Plasticicumulans lactativorans]